jgi:hypothetical protein
MPGATKRISKEQQLMKRIVTYFRKPERSTIQGVANAAMIQVLSGQRCTGSADFGGGYVGEMVLRDGLIEIHKVDEQGKPMRNFGKTTITTTKGQAAVTIQGDFVAVPAAQCFGVVVNEVAEPGDEKPAPSADQVEAAKAQAKRTAEAEQAALKKAEEARDAQEKYDLNQPAKPLPKVK